MKTRPPVINPNWTASFSAKWIDRLARWGGVPQSNRVAIAKLANYKAAEPSRTNELHGWYGTNPNSATAQIERVRMQWTGEHLAKNVPFASAYLKTRIMYCAPLAWIPDTGDNNLNAELSAYLIEHWEDGGMNCSMWEAFSRTADCEQPVRGDAGLIWYRDENRYRLMEFSADQLGELYQYVRPVSNALNGLSYFAGIYFYPNGQRAAFRVYERGYNAYYTHPDNYDANDVLYFSDNMFRGIRGISSFHAAILSIEKGDRFLQAGINAGEKQAAHSGIVKNMAGSAAGELVYEDEANQFTGEITHVERRMDGTWERYMFHGDDYVPTRVEMPGQELLSGVEACKEEACLALGFPFSFLVNSSKVGGAPSRLEINKAGKEISRLTRLRMRNLNKIAYITIMDAVDRGVFPAARNIDKGHFQFPNLPTADAFRDANEDIQSLRYGLDSAQRILGRYGESFPVVLEEKKQAAIQIAIAVQEANKELVERGYKPTVRGLDIAQTNENPVQEEGSEVAVKGVSNPSIPTWRTDKNLSSPKPQNGNGQPEIAPIRF